MYTINLQINDEIYEKYTPDLKPYSIGGVRYDKYGLREFNSLLFENAIKNLTEETILSILESMTAKNTERCLNEKQVDIIKYLLERGDMFQQDIATFFNVSDGLISQIKNGVTWSKA